MPTRHSSAEWETLSLHTQLPAHRQTSGSSPAGLPACCCQSVESSLQAALLQCGSPAGAACILLAPDWHGQVPADGGTCTQASFHEGTPQTHTLGGAFCGLILARIPLNALHLALQLVTSNITQYYTSRTTYNTPEQWVSKLVFSAQNQGYADVVIQTGPVTIQLKSGRPLTIPITNATNNATCESGCSPRAPGQHCSLPCITDPALPTSRLRHWGRALLPPALQLTALDRDSALRVTAGRT